jgi:hypothetical protein
VFSINSRAPAPQRSLEVGGDGISSFSSFSASDSAACTSAATAASQALAYSVYLCGSNHFGVVQAAVATVSLSACALQQRSFSDSGNSAVRLCSATNQHQP